ncbi:MAG TPA: DUF4097 family beta strand repeat-containing protein [Chloroflexia bacterium]|nr:DUF4097 family beta strand repeat-containing protein [Chloroflexia bacterium]
MPVFATPQPIIVTIDVAVGDLRLIAGDRIDTSVEVRPSHRSRAADVKAAEMTRVEYANGRLLIKGPRQRFRLFRSDSIDVTIELPAGSDVYGTVGMGEFRVEGRIGECRFHTAMGDLSLDQTGTLNLNSDYGNVTVNQVMGQANINTTYGSITVDRLVGHADISTGSGHVRIRELDGPATIKNSNGNTTIVEATGELQLNGANGNISVDRTRSSVTARIAYGNIRIGEVVRGSILLETAYGQLEVGIRAGTAAWLDVSTKYGSVRNSLHEDAGPQQSDETAEVRAHTTYGDITILRST